MRFTRSRIENKSNVTIPKEIEKNHASPLLMARLYRHPILDLHPPLREGLQVPFVDVNHFSLWLTIHGSQFATTLACLVDASHPLRKKSRRGWDAQS